MRSTAAIQSTPRVRCSTSSARHSSPVVSGRASALASSGARGSWNVDVGEDRAHLLGRARHQRRVGGDADRQHDRPLGAQLFARLSAAPSTAARSPLTTIWPGRVAVGDGEDADGPPAATSSGTRAARRRPMIGGHRAVLAPTPASARRARGRGAGRRRATARRRRPSRCTGPSSGRRRRPARVRRQRPRPRAPPRAHAGSAIDVARMRRLGS